ncbi:MAG: hypothetical protein RR857_20020 [Comamonas sp.]
MALPIFGAQAAVSIVNRALSNSSPANNVYLNQVSNAGSNAASEYAFAGQLGASYAVGKTPAQLAEMILANVGISATTIPAESYDILLAAGTDYIAFHGTQNIGIIALQFGQIISGLENDVTFGNAAKAWNAEVLAAYNYSSNASSTAPQTGEGVPGNTNIVLTAGQDTITGTSADDTFKANVVQNQLGQQVNSLGSGDILDGGAGYDTLAAKVTNGSFVGGSASMPIQAETNSIEHIQIQAVLADVGGNTADDQVFVNAKDMIGVTKISSNYSDASLTVMNLTTKGSAQLTDLTVNMSYTGNANSRWDESDFKVLFDQDYLVPQKTLGDTSVEFLAMNEDNYDDTDGAAPLDGVFFRTLNFRLNGELFNLAAELGEDAASKGDEIKTYDDFLAAVQKGLDALKAKNPDNAALQSVTASLGNPFKTDVNPETGIQREGTSIRLTAEGQTNGTANALTVTDFDLEIARAGLATIRNNNRYERAEADPADEGSKLGINVELEKVGLAGDGGELVIGSMNKADDDNIWKQANTVVAKTTNGINEFYVTVKGNDEKSSSLAELRSTNNQLKVVTVKTDAAQTGTYANLTIGNSNTDGYSADDTFNYKNSLKDVQTFDAKEFKGDLNLQASLTSEVVAKYLNLQDQAPDAPDADNVSFVYDGGTGNDSIDLQVSAINFAEQGNATREDMTVTINGGAGNDEITLTVVENDNSGNAAATANWYTNQSLNANLFINAGEGNDIIRTPGSGDVVIDAGTGNDTVYIDNLGNKAVWVLNSVLGSTNVNDLASSANNSYNLYKGSAVVSFKGFEASAVIADKNGVVTDLSINQAIKAAISADATLSKLLVAKDGPANTLVITSLIDGAIIPTEQFAVSLQAPTTLTATELSQLSTWYGSTATVAAQTAVAAAFNSVTNTTYLNQLSANGSNSGFTSDNTITGGLGDDVLVLGTGANSNETLVYKGFGNGIDSIVNFDTTWLAAGTPVYTGQAAVAEEITVTFGATDGTPAQTIIFDGVTVTLAAPATQGVIPAADVAYQFVSQYNASAAPAATWTAVLNADNTVSLTNDVAGAVTDVAAADFTGTYTGSKSVAINEQGTDAIVVGTQSTFLLTFDVAATAAAAAGTFTFDGATIAYSQGDGAITLANKLEATTFANWTVVNNDNGSLTFTAKAPGATAIGANADFDLGTNTIVGAVVGAPGAAGVGTPIVTVSPAGAGAGFDYIDFSAYDAAAVVINGSVVAGTAATAGQTYISLTSVVGGHAGEYTVAQFTEAGAIDTQVGLIGTLDFGVAQDFVSANFIL